MGERGKGAGAEVLFSRKWESLASVHLTPAFKNAGVRCTKLVHFACQPVHLAYPRVSH